jgi:hypothetical protein
MSRMIDLPAWRWRLQFWFQRWSYMGWCMFAGHAPPVWMHRGEPVCGPVLVCPRCGHYVRWDKKQHGSGLE